MVNKLPKSQRFVLGQRIENKTIDLMRSFIVANVERDKYVILHRVSTELDELRIFIRLAKLRLDSAILREVGDTMK